ncbi:MAG: hypothetical protein MUP52_12715 [Candidatus Aminicenantes bacterium]|nr:hypothetical protein [Candidatus Aminicenantes bacterium]
MTRIVIGAVLVALYVLGALAPGNAQTNRDFLLGGAIIFLIPGFLFVYFGVKGRRRSKSTRAQSADMPTVLRIEDVAQFTRANDIAGLLRAFSLSANWETRELLVVALGIICRDARQGRDYSGDEMVNALRSIVELCTAESSGGTYRTNCIEHAQMLLSTRFGKDGSTPTGSVPRRDLTHES